MHFLDLQFNCNISFLMKTTVSDNSKDKQLIICRKYDINNENWIKRKLYEQSLQAFHFIKRLFLEILLFVFNFSKLFLVI